MHRLASGDPASTPWASNRSPNRATCTNQAQTSSQQPAGPLSTRLVREWRATLLRDGVSVSVAAKAYRLLRVILMTAVEEDNLLPRNPCRIRGAGDERRPNDQHEARGADKRITNAIDTHVQGEQHKGDDDDGQAGALVPAG